MRRSSRARVLGRGLPHTEKRGTVRARLAKGCGVYARVVVFLDKILTHYPNYSRECAHDQCLQDVRPRTKTGSIRPGIHTNCRPDNFSPRGASPTSGRKAPEFSGFVRSKRCQSSIQLIRKASRIRVTTTFSVKWESDTMAVAKA